MKSTLVTLLNGTNRKYADKIDPDFLHRMDGLYAFYHRQWWYRRQMFYHFKHCHGFLNGLALLIMAMSVVVGAVWEDSLVMIGLTAFGTVVKKKSKVCIRAKWPTRPELIPVSEA